jgi:hypothetical protein
MINTCIVEQHLDQPVVPLDCRERRRHAIKVGQVALVMRPIAGAVRTDIDADRKMTGLRQATAGRLADQAIAAGDDRDLSHAVLPVGQAG